MGTIRKGILVLDPRTKILLLLGINIFVFTNSHVYAEMLVVAALVILLLLCGVYKTALKSTITYIVLLAIKCWILPFCPEIIMTSLNIVVITFRKLLPCVTLGALLVQTTPIRLLMHAMQKWHLPQAVIIPLAITVRYFPTLHEEQQAISDAMKLRNVHQLFSDSVWEEFSLLNKTVDEQEITKILRRLDLLDYKDKHPMTLSGGQKQRLALAVATLANKDIMIFDEPTSGLDYGNMIKVCELIKELSSNRIVFVATHDRELMGLLCTRRMEISNESISVYDLTTK